MSGQACLHCGQPAAHLTRIGWCRADYLRWIRAGKPASGPPPSKYQRADPTAPRLCQDCGRPIPALTRCGACSTWRRDHRGEPFPRGVPPRLRAGWVDVPGLGWVPPAGYCAPGETYGQVAGCPSCAYASECQAMSLAAEVA